MSLRNALILIPALAATAFATSRTSPPSGSITVCSDDCDYTTVRSQYSRDMLPIIPWLT